MTSSHPAFDFEVITPDGTAFRGRVHSVRLRGKDGDFGILARHAPLVAALDTGVARLELEDGHREKLVLGEGFVEVTKRGARALVDFCNTQKQIDLARAEQASRRAKERLHDRTSKIDHERAEAALRRAVARMVVARGIEI
jgi:F-type H+-transporting ATPase subunit epsilon